MMQCEFLPLLSQSMLAHQIVKLEDYTLKPLFEILLFSIFEHLLSIRQLFLHFFLFLFLKARPILRVGWVMLI